METTASLNPKYTITLTGSSWSVIRYGIAEYLRFHKFWRALVAILGVGMLSFEIVSELQIWTIQKRFGITALIVGSAFLYLAIVSGSAFELKFREREAEQEREAAEKQLAETDTPEDALNLDFARLNEYYVINQAQARSSYRWAIFSMLLGLSTIVAGIWLFYFIINTPNTFMASLSTAAGIVVNLISGLFLFVYSKTQERSLLYYDQLSSLKAISLAMRLVEEHKDIDKQSEARNLVIKQLLSRNTDSSVARPRTSM